MKRINLIPLVILLLCSGLSLSSGLYYDDINGAVYLIPIGLTMLIFYAVRALLGNYRKKELAGMVIAAFVSLVAMLLFYKMISPGYCELYNEISNKVSLVYGLDMEACVVEPGGSVTLAICQLVSFVTILSLYLVETGKPAAVTALPSFLLFILSISADGVPYEACLIAYGGALLVFLGMGRRGENIARLLTLTICTVVVAVAVFFIYPWPRVENMMEKTWDKIVELDFGEGGSEPEEYKPEDKKQTIDFGQFNQSGDITYSGTVELMLTPTEEFPYEDLYLRTFVGTTFTDNYWHGQKMSEYDSSGDAFPRYEGVKIENVYDKGIFVPCVVDKQQFNKLMKKKYSKRLYNEDLPDATDGITSYLRRRIQNEILEDSKFETVGDAVEFVKTYFINGFKYTLHPGKLEDGVDEVTKFLFETKKGYCTHFASAAVMIFRSMGIRAHIVQGYSVSGLRLKPNTPVSVYDSDAHAWVEIYIHNRGWVPIDVTPYNQHVVTAEDKNADAGDAKVTDDGDDTPIQVGEDFTYATDSEPESEQESTTQEDDGDDEGDEGEEPPGKSTKKDGMRERERRRESSSQAAMSPAERRVLILRLCLLVILVVGVLIGVRIIYRRRCYARMSREADQGDFSRRLLFVNRELESFWRNLGVPWSFRDSRRQIEAIFRMTGKYYLFGTVEEWMTLQESIRGYVLAVYESRYGRKSIDTARYEACLNYLTQLIRAVCQGTEQKRWKRLQRCSMVKYLERKENKEDSNE